MSEAPDPQRKRIRILLIAAIVVLGGVLAAMVARCADRKQDGPAPEDGPQLPADTSRHVRVRDAEGKVIPGADALVMKRPDAPQTTDWHPGVGVLVLPDAPGSFRVRLIAPGHRIRDFPAVEGGQTLRLDAGLVAKVSLRDVPEDGLPAYVRFLLRVKPVAITDQGIDAKTVIDLMDNRGGPGSGPQYVPREGIGYTISREQAAAGIVLPSTGRFHVHWGLIDTRPRRAQDGVRKRGVWFSLGDSCGRTIDVKESEAPQPFAMDVTLEDLQATRDGLAKRAETTGALER